jgi:glutamine cyclotransferase
MQGWGIVTDGTHLIMSDGSEHLNFFDFPEQVQMNGGELKKVITESELRCDGCAQQL